MSDPLGPQGPEKRARAAEQRVQEDQVDMISLDLESFNTMVAETARLKVMERRILALMEEYSDSPMLSMTNVWKAVHG